MKKLMIAAAAMLIGVAANAQAVNWSVNEILINGDLGKWSGDFAPSGWGVYLFDSATYAYDSMATALGSGNLDTITTALGNNAGFATTGANGAFNAEGATAQTGTYYTYAVIVDGGDISKASWAFLVEENDFTVGATAIDAGLSNTQGGWDAKYIGATSYGTAGNGWYSVVPEPTTGLLVLVGLAGVALKRKLA